jgi:type III secretion protein T
MTEYDQVAGLLSGMATTLPRIASAFLVLPLLSSDDMPATVRNSFFASLALVVLPLVQHTAPVSFQGLPVALMLLKEVFIGLCIGYAFGLIFWAVGNVGNLIDTKTGATLASIVDPIAGHQTSLTGAFLSRFSNWLFLASGGFLVFLETLLGSYSVWPPGAALPTLHKAGEMYFVGLLDELMAVTLLLAAPALVVLFLVEIAFGLINRYAQQLNVVSLASSLKTWVSAWIVMLSLGVTVEFVMKKVGAQHALLALLQRVL